MVDAFLEPGRAAPQMQFLALGFLESLLSGGDEQDVTNLKELARCLRHLWYYSLRNHFLTMYDMATLNALQNLGVLVGTLDSVPDQYRRELARRFREGCLLTCKDGRTLGLVESPSSGRGPDYLGIVPCDARKGDRVCVFEGVHTPF